MVPLLSDSCSLMWFSRRRIFLLFHMSSSPHDVSYFSKLWYFFGVHHAASGRPHSRVVSDASFFSTLNPVTP